MKRLSIAPFALALLLAACGGPQFTTTLAGSNEVPPVTGSSATGTVTATLDGMKLKVTGEYSGLSGPATNAHIHGPAPVGQNGGVVCNLTYDSAASGALSGDCDVQEAAAAGKLDTTNLNSGNFYVNIHTGNNQGGEIRGNLTKK